MLRLTWPTSARPMRLLSEEEFIREFGPLAERARTSLPAGPMQVEGLDEQHRVTWTGHYKDAYGLITLVRQLEQERGWRAERGREGGPK